MSVSRTITATAIALLAAASSPAFANEGAGVITTVVTPLSSRVTYSTDATASPARAALVTSVGYTVSITNRGRETVNHIHFTGRTSVTDRNEKATFSSVDGGYECHHDRTSVDCEIGQLRAGQSAATFAVFFNAPVKDTVTPIPDGVVNACAVTDCIAFSGTTDRGEGSDDSRSDRERSAGFWAAAPVALGTTNPDRIKSAVPKSGGTYFTGAAGVPTAADNFTTSIVVPAGPTYTTAEIVETPLSLPENPNCHTFITCYKSQLTIPGAFSPYLTIVLRQDASNIKPGMSINSAVIFYDDEHGFRIVLDCASPTTPRIDGLPCIAKRVTYSNAEVPGWTPELDGDFEWTLINIKNGGYTID